MSPNGVLLPCVQSHVVDIINQPEAFGTTRGRIEAAYRRHGEPIGQEARAREELIRNAVATGWIRFRRYPREGPRWSVTAAVLDDNTRKRLSGLCRRLVVGIDGRRETDLESLVTALLTAEEEHVNLGTVGEISEGSLLGESKDRKLEPLPVGDWNHLHPASRQGRAE